MLTAQTWAQYQGTDSPTLINLAPINQNFHDYTILLDFEIIRLYIKMQQFNKQMKITWPQNDS